MRSTSRRRATTDPQRQGAVEKYGLLDSDGRLNKAIAIALLDTMMQEEAMREEVLSFLVKVV